MHRKETSAVIARPGDEVFAWVTTPGWWPQVSPVVLGIEAPEPWRPLRAGDRVREHVRINGWSGRIDWTVESIDAPRRCVLTGVSSGEGLVSRLAGHEQFRLELTCADEGSGTRLTREIAYPVGIAEAVGNLFGFSEAFDRAADITMTTIVSTLENPLRCGPRADVASDTWLHEADPLADDAVASLVTPFGDCSPLENFIARLYRGVPPLDDAPPAVQRFFAATAELPSWTCAPRLAAASDVFLDWGVLAVGAHICASLPETYVLPRTAKLLNLTRQLDADPTHADRRIWFTVRMCFDVLAENGLQPGGEGGLALQRLRLIHAMIRLFAQRRVESPHRLAKLSTPELWDAENGQPISQLELVHTLLTFSHVVVRAFDILGAELTPYQREAYIHLWNVAGAQLGIRPELLPRDAADAERMFEAIKARYGRPTEDAARLGRGLVWFWTSLFPAVLREEASELMRYVLSQLISPETAKINGLEDLPAFSPAAAHAVRDALGRTDRLCAFAFDELPGARQATALFISLLMRARTGTFQDESGTFDIPKELYERWRTVPVAAE